MTFSTTIDKKLPMYIGFINPDRKSDLLVNCVALVDRPAIDKLFLAFNENKLSMNFTEIDNKKRIVVGPAMLPDTPIYRNDPELGEYNVMFYADTICEVAEKFFALKLNDSANIMHDPNQKCEGVTYFLSFIRDTKNNMIGMSGEYPEGTWFLGAKIDNEDVWNKIISGEVKGFSVEGLFGYARIEDSLDEYEVKFKKIELLVELDTPEAYQEILEILEIENKE